ncbi:MAG: oligoendopeptidase F [Ignavibacteriaceae bacterium]|jgi:oligoendopeptidase F
MPESGTLPLRDEIEVQYKWNLTDIFESDEAWEASFHLVEAKIPELKKFEGILTESSDNILNYLKLEEEVGIILERLHLLAMLSKDSDMTVTKYQSMDSRVNTLVTNYSSNNSFFKPEILKLPKETIDKWCSEKDEFKKYSHFFNDLFREKPHTLTSEEEKIVALTAELKNVPQTTFSLFTNADLQFPKIDDGTGNEIEISHGRFYSALYSEKRTFRETVYKAYYKPFMQYANTFSSLLMGNIKGNIFTAKVKKFNSAREASLFRNNISTNVYDNLIETVNQNFEPMHRWTALKKKILKLDEFHPFDSYVNIFPYEEKKYSYDESVTLVKKALQPLGKNYLQTLERAFSERWIDVFETRSKRSGAYSSGTTFGVHPYVLLNWNNQLNDVFTLAHEMGHNMHSYYTGASQPYTYANYSIFLAEVASTFNESLLLEYLLEHSRSKEEKLFLYEKYLNNVTTTFYRQTMFAEYESQIHKLVEEGASLTATDFRNLYKNLYQKYWGDEMFVDVEEEYTWARIPHFYYNFYVYQYATGFAASELLVQKVKNEGEAAVKKYLGFLNSGSSKYSLDILNDAGVDMTSSEPIFATINKMSFILNEIEKLIN